MTLRATLGAAWLCLVVAGGGCDGVRDPSLGSFSLGLAGQGATGVIYRLRDATITVAGAASTRDWHTEDDPDQTVLSDEVAAGDYSVQLHDGWRIERLNGTAATTVAARLVSDNPAAFSVVASRRTSVVLRFRVDGDTVAMDGGYDLTISVDDLPHVLVISDPGSTPGFPSVATFAADDAGDVAPLRAISGPSTGLGDPLGVVGVGDELIVSDAVAGDIKVFPRGASGDVAPTRTIAGASTTLTGAFGITVSGGEIYAVRRNGLAVFPLGARGNVAPARSLDVLHLGGHLAVDHGEIFLDTQDPEGVVVYPAAASGASSPARSLTFMDGCPSGLAVAGGELYIADLCGGRIVVVPQTAAGAIDPVRVIAGPSTRLGQPVELAISGDELYVTETSARLVLVFPLHANGDVAPIRVLGGNHTGFVFPFGIAVP